MTQSITIMKQKLALVSLAKSNLLSSQGGILQLALFAEQFVLSSFFFSSSFANHPNDTQIRFESPFFSFTETENEASLVVDEKSFPVIEQSSEGMISEGPVWKALEIFEGAEAISDLLKSSFSFSASPSHYTPQI